jgi:hypothetical protein
LHFNYHRSPTGLSRAIAPARVYAATPLARRTIHYFANPLVAAYVKVQETCYALCTSVTPLTSLGKACEGGIMTLKAQWYRDKFAKKRGKGFCGYPVATVAFYGPDDTRATKVSVGIVAYEDADADPLERWFCETTDARSDPEITEAIARFIDHHGAKSVAASDRIIGCPHEEGIDYPEGEKCKQCSFWAHRDRWSGEIVQ